MHRRVLTFLIALPLLLAAAIWQINLKTDISAFFMAGDSPQTTLLASNMQSGEISRRYLLSISRSESGEQAAEFIETLRSELLKIDGISRIWGEGLTEEEIQALTSLYLPYRHHLYSLIPANDVAEAFSESMLAQRASATRQGLLSPQSQWVKEILAQDPMFLISNWPGSRRGSVYKTLIPTTRAP